MEKIFYCDSTGSPPITFGELKGQLLAMKSLPAYIHTANTAQVFQSLIASLLSDQPITFLDSDFSEVELKALGIGEKELSIQSALTLSEKNFPQQCSHIGNALKDWSLALYTSGTTGIPKKISHSFASLTRNVKVDSRKADNVWGFAFNPTHIAGLQVFFQALLNGNSIINLFNNSKDEVFKLIEKYAVTNISATPTWYRLLLPHQGSYPTVQRITSGGEKFDARLTNHLSQLFPNARILNIYASTEAGTLLTASGENFTIAPEMAQLLRIQDNQLQIHRSYLGEGTFSLTENAWYNTGDLVEIITEHPLSFRFISRQNSMINVGGYKVNPEEVEELINSHPAIQMSRIYGRKNSVLGNIVCADIVLNTPITEKEIKEYLKDKLQPFKIPRIINFLDSIPLSRSGKVLRS